MSKGDLLIIQEAERLQDFIFEITSKDAKPISSDKSGEKPLTGIPKKYRFSISARLQNYSLDLFEQIDRARFDSADRRTHLNSVLSTLRMIESVFWLCFRHQFISNGLAERGSGLVGAVRAMAITWRDKSKP